MDNRHFAQLVLAILLFSGCGSDELEVESSPAPVAVPQVSQPVLNPLLHLEGNWQGTLTPDSTMTGTNAILLVNGWGEFRLLAGDAQFIGFPRRTQAGLNGDLTGIRSAGSAWSDGEQITSFTLNGSIDEDWSITAEYSGNADSGSMALEWEPGKESVSISAIAGTWVLLDEHENHVAVFDFDIRGDWQALATGTHANGCVFSGVAEAWTSYRSYDLAELSISNCPLIEDIDFNGDYPGTAAIIDVADDGTDELALVIGVSNDVNQLTYILYRR